MLNAMTRRTKPQDIKRELVATVVMALWSTFLAAFRAMIGANEHSTCECMIDGISGSEFFGAFFSSSFLTFRNTLAIFPIPVFPVPFFGCFSVWLTSHLSSSSIRFPFVFSHFGGISTSPFSLVLGRGV
jgi:hypothetical protein